MAGEHLTEYKIKQTDRRIVLGVETYYLFEVDYSDSMGNMVYRVFSDWIRFNSLFFMSKLWTLTNNCIIKMQEKILQS